MAHKLKCINCGCTVVQKYRLKKPKCSLCRKDPNHKFYDYVEYKIPFRSNRDIVEYVENELDYLFDVINNNKKYKNIIVNDRRLLDMLQLKWCLDNKIPPYSTNGIYSFYRVYRYTTR